MSEPQKNYSEFDRMSTAELEDLLRADFQTENNEAADMDVVLYIMKIIADRKKQEDHREYPDAEQAWESFNQNYRSLSEPLWGEAPDDNDPISLHKGPGRHKNRLWRYLAGIAAAAAIIVGCNSLTTQALGYHLWDMIVQWTNEAFGFGTKEYQSQDGAPENEGEKYDSLQQALDHYHIKEKLVPTWIPQDFVLSDIEVTESLEVTYFTALYENQDEYIVIKVNNIQNDNYSTFEKDDTKVECFTVNDVEHYILSNLDYDFAVWLNGENECSIMIPDSVTRDELKHMIQSIYER